MPTKLSRYAEGLMEAAWLVAVVMTPLFFNKYSSRIFEPDKATLLRTLTLIMLAAWLVKVVDEGIHQKKSGSINDTLKSLVRVPMILPVVVMAVSYMLATILSVTPRISLWGSYQRLQGTYTTLSYLVIFAAMVVNLRKRKQVDRLITTAILSSLPVSLYGVLQRYGIDPIPWGGDVTNRVASHMGNSIFVSAYLIMIFPLTVGRIVDSFRAILNEGEGLGSQVARSTVYIFIAALELIAIYFSFSRGPLLGLIAGSFFLFILLSLYWNKRWMTVAVVALAGLVGVFLILLNIPEGPLETIRDAPGIGRLGQVFDLEQRTSQVRILIWGGAVDMVLPHDPLEYPDGHKDPFNILRPIIGYGPETMHMAYNPFYPPELAHTEKRNASPDRSHNETWDSLVITGALGLGVYLAIFASVFYYGLKWLWLINTQKQRNLFFGLFFGGGFASATAFILLLDPAFFGVGLPFGIILGLIAYLTLSALFFKPENEQTAANRARSLTLIVLLAGVMSHFVEINFGIAIVSTRTYFWVYAALLLLVGYLLPQRGEYLTEQVEDTKPEIRKSPQKKRRRGKTRRPSPKQADWIKLAIIGGCIGALILIPLTYEYISNLNGSASANDILWTSLTRVKKDTISYGVLALTITAWLAAGVVLSSENNQSKGQSSWLQTFGSILGISGGITFFYALWLSGTLASLARSAPTTTQEVLAQAAAFEGLLSQYYIYIILIMFALAALLPEEWPRRSSGTTPIGPILAPVALIIAFVLTNLTNLRVIQSDIAFKMAEPFTKSNQWPVAILLYQRAIELAPDEDYYYLFLGRAYLEHTKTLGDPAEQEEIFNQAEVDLVHAQEINPLNPDHTANLGRLYSWWAMQTTDPDERRRRGEVSDSYYERVTVLSPNSARLWDEWGTLHFSVLKQPDRARELLEHSLEIDPTYDWTHALLGDYYSQTARSMEDEADRIEYLEQAAFYYSKAIEYSNTPTRQSSQGMNYFFALASAYQSLADYESMIDTLEMSLEYARAKDDIWKIEENLARTYVQVNDKVSAILHASNALSYAPETEFERLQTLIAQLQSLP
jgi:tetratricopeptide (TPR) repeat protein/O-antigen ligase